MLIAVAVNPRASFGRARLADGERIGALPMTIEAVPHAVCVLA